MSRLYGDEHPLTCAECGRQPREGENPLDDWRSYTTGIELLNFCPECAEREFGGDAACAAAHRVRRSG